MKINTVTGFFVAGFSARTQNSDEAAGLGKIPEIWGEFMQSDLATLLPNVTGEDVYAVYSDYEGDHTGAYNFLLGVKVSSLADLPAGMTGVEIPSGEYAVVTSAEGPPQQVVPAAWAAVWNDKELENARSYRVDFEVYGDRAQVDIYLGIGHS